MNGATGGPDVRRAVNDDVGVLVEVLARAFDDDPVPNFLFRGDRARHKGLRRFFSIQLRHMYMDVGEVWTTEAVTGAALWAPPTMRRPGWNDLLHLVPVVPYLARLGRRAPDVGRLLSAVDRARPTDMHWYLATLGTDPAHQGQGIGSSLVQTTLDRADAEGLPAYLESSKEENLAFYGRHGFEVTGEIHTPGGGPTLWLMWRDARPLGA
jgi:ribosomal protein S18 acetylase RimI-like enzyme